MRSVATTEMRSIGDTDVPGFIARGETTYECEYKFIKVYPVPRFHNYISFTVNTPHKLIPRCYPHYSLHISPHRHLDLEGSDIGFRPIGGKYVRPSVEAGEQQSKEMRRECGCDSQGDSMDSANDTRAESNKESEDKSEFKCKVGEMKKSVDSNGPVRSKSGEKTLRDRFKEVYKSTAQCAAEEWALPVPARPAALPQILGTNADRELYHSVHHRTGSWKANTVPFMWERCQERCLSEDSKKCRSRGAGLSASKPRLLQREQQRKYLIGKPKETEQLATPADVHIHRPPGYAGFVPRLPVVPSAPRDPRVALSSSALTYRPLPSTELRIAKYAHKGPLSKLVTTTSPCNPFKKGTVYPDQRFR